MIDLEEPKVTEVLIAYHRSLRVTMYIGRGIGCTILVRDIINDDNTMNIPVHAVPVDMDKTNPELHLTLLSSCAVYRVGWELAKLKARHEKLKESLLSLTTESFFETGE